MSTANTYIVPLPVRLDTYRQGEVDERAIDFSRDLIPYADHLATVNFVRVVSRDDSKGLTPEDLKIIIDSPDQVPWIDQTGYIVGWWQTASDSIARDGVSVDYQLTVEATTQAGRIIICDAMQLLVAARG